MNQSHKVQAYADIGIIVIFFLYHHISAAIPYYALPRHEETKVAAVRAAIVLPEAAAAAQWQTVTSTKNTNYELPYVQQWRWRSRNTHNCKLLTHLCPNTNQLLTELEPSQNTRWQ